MPKINPNQNSNTFLKKDKFEMIFEFHDSRNIYPKTIRTQLQPYQVFLIFIQSQDYENIFLKPIKEFYKKRENIQKLLHKSKLIQYKIYGNHKIFDSTQLEGISISND